MKRTTAPGTQPSMKMMKARTAVTAMTMTTAAALGLLAGGLSSCRGEDIEFDCTSQRAAFKAAFADDGVLLPEITDDASYPMAMVLSEEGLQRLLNGLVGNDVPFASDLPLGPITISFKPTTAPVIQIVKVPNCTRCVLFSLDFSFEMLDDGGPSGSGIGSAELAIPLRLQQNEDGSSSLVAGYESATVRDMPLNTLGFDTGDYPGLEGALEVLATDALRAQFKTTELMRFQPWSIGNGDVKLAARNFQIFTESRVLSLGMQTNLDMPRGVAVKVGEELPMGIPLQVQMHPGLLLGMSQRMITEGEISRTYNDAGKPDPEGLYGVTLERFNTNPIPGSKLMDVGFRVWRTEEGYCGYADAETSLALALDDVTSAISVTPTDRLDVVGGEGVGELAEGNEELIQKNKNLVAFFKKDLSEQVGITVNYNEVNIPGSNVVFDTVGLQVEQDSINILIDLQVYASQDP